MTSAPFHHGLSCSTSRAPLALALVLLASCHSPGPYGHAVQYAPTSEEESATRGARAYDPVMVQREPEVWRKGKVVLFGVVNGRAPGPGGAAHVTLKVRRLEPRNLCGNANDEDSCRVTVSDRDFGVVHAFVALQPQDDTGEASLGIGSLVRVVGALGEDVDPSDGSPVVRSSFYRHWPRFTYATTANADLLRQ